MNEFIDRLVLWLSSEKPKIPTESAIFKIQNAEVVDGTFLLDDEQEKTFPPPRISIFRIFRS